MKDIRKLIESGASAKDILEKEDIKGGLADGKSLQDIAGKHGVDISKIKSQYAKGLRVEMEHTPDKKVAEEIVMDHLMEDPNYYTKLATIEVDKMGEAYKSKRSPSLQSVYQDAAMAMGNSRLRIQYLDELLDYMANQIGTLTAAEKKAVKDAYNDDLK